MQTEQQQTLWPHFSTGEEMDVTFSINSPTRFSFSSACSQCLKITRKVSVYSITTTNKNRINIILRLSKISVEIFWDYFQTLCTFSKKSVICPTMTKE